MNCEHAHRVLDAYLDSELDNATQAEVQRHLAGCLGCARLLADRDDLRSGLRRLPRHGVPARLRTAVTSALASEGRPATVPADARKPRRWPAGRLIGSPLSLAFTAFAALTAFLLGLWAATPPGAQDLREGAIDRHVASFDGGAQQVQVTSTDRHVVKPWFAGKLDFAPPVRELSGQGFALVGGRLDTLGGQTVGVLVYRVRQHVISLFVSRASVASASPVLVSSLRGFAVVSWTRDGLAFTVVSDVDRNDLQRFAELVRGPAP